VVVDVVSPRVFEAAALGTAMIMFPGEYSGVVSPGEHYIVLEKDFSNMEEVVQKLRDDKLVAAMTARARRDVIESGRWSYQMFVAGFDQVVDDEARGTRGRSMGLRYRAARAERAIWVPPLTVRIAQGAGRLLRRDPSMRFNVEYQGQLTKGLLAVRVALADRDLRALLRLGRRSGASLDRLLREILELSLLRKAAAGSLPGQSFALRAELDVVAKALRFVSVPAGRAASPGEPSTAVREALRSVDLKSIEWDHRALGGLIHLVHPDMEIGIGFHGLESFTVITAIGHRNPTALERALAPALEPDRESLPVG
jgi:hypothetical protein